MKTKHFKGARIEDLVPDDRNFNRHTKRGMHLLRESISQFGFGRSIVVDKNNRVIAGNGVLETACSLSKSDCIVVPTDGDTLVVVKRTDVDLDSQKGRELALADNATGKANLAWDEEVIAQAVEEYGLNTNIWDVTLDELQAKYRDVSCATPRKERDEFEEEFNSITDATCEMPIVPDFFESHECFVIPVHNSIDEGFVRDLFGLNEIYRSASGDKKERRTNVITVEKLRKIIK